jgi:hypothetical protein
VISSNSLRGWKIPIWVLLATCLVPASTSGQQGLDEEAARFAARWSAGDSEALAQAMRSEGIRLTVLGEEHVAIQPKQAQAALRSLLGRYPRGQTTVTRVSAVGGDPSQGFAEIRWRTQASGVPDPVIFSIFVGYVLEEQGWRVTEIRVFY